MAQIFKQTLDKYKVPEKEQQELFAVVGTTKADIVMAK
jgi:hemoglobin